MYRKKSLRMLLFAAAVFAGLWMAAGNGVYARVAYENPDTGYEVILEDDAELLTDEEEEALACIMEGITEYGGAAFKTIDVNSTTTKSYIEDYYQDLFGSRSGTVFLIDMDNRNIWIFSDGAVHRVITNSYADTITDNAYSYASDGDYYGCSCKVFEQMLTLLKGYRIARPMKYISNAVLALIIGLTICFFVVIASSITVRPDKKQLLEGVKHTFALTDKQTIHKRTTRKYDPPSSSGGSGGHSGGGGGGGGGHSGGGGGHSF